MKVAGLLSGLLACLLTGRTSAVFVTPPRFSANPATGFHAIGSSVTFTCESTIDTTNKLTDYQLFLDNSLFAHTATNTWTLQSLKLSRSGTYSCIVTVDGVQSSQSNGYVLTVSAVLTGECGTRPYFDSQQFKKIPRNVGKLSGLRAPLSGPRAPLSGPRAPLSGPRAPLSRPRAPRIVGGHRAAYAEYPWQARVHLLDKVHPSLCGAAIINNYWLLSAAHCFDPLKQSKYRIIIGGRDIREKEAEQQTFHIDTLIVHAEYVHVLKINDIALIKIRPNNGAVMQFSDVIQPACLPTNTTPHTEGLECLVSGWGWTGKENSDYLKGAVLKIVNEDKCRKPGRYLDDGMMCAGVSEGIDDTCGGDSGGPLVVDNNGSYTLLGLTSFGWEACGVPGKPGVYAKVAHFLPWIEANMAANSDSGEKTLPKP